MDSCGDAEAEELLKMAEKIENQREQIEKFEP